MEQDRLLKFFAYAHLPANLQAHSKPFAELANHIVSSLQPSAERTVALRKLLEAKDCAVRAALDEPDFAKGGPSGRGEISNGN